MTSFDEILHLEDRELNLERELAKQRDLARGVSKRHMEARQDVEKLTLKIKQLTESLRGLRLEHPVVLLSEFEFSVGALENARDDLIQKRIEIAKLAKDTRALDGTMASLEAQLQQVRQQRAKYGKVLSFK
jgi:archaellum component FlaC